MNIFLFSVHTILCKHFTLQFFIQEVLLCKQMNVSHVQSANVHTTTKWKIIVLWIKSKLEKPEQLLLKKKILTAILSRPKCNNLKKRSVENFQLLRFLFFNLWAVKHSLSFFDNPKSQILYESIFRLYVNCFIRMGNRQIR